MNGSDQLASIVLNAYKNFGVTIYDVMDPFITLTAAASVTKQLKLGTGVCLVNQRDPIQTAKLVASIDQVSNGRFLFGVGNGWNQDEMENHGTAFATRHKLVRERIEAMKAIWTQTKAEYRGEFVNFDPMMTWPKPVQKPHPPIIVGGAYPYAARRAVRYGDGWIPLAGRATQYGDVFDYVPKFRDMLKEAGRDPATFPISLFGSTEDPPQPVDAGQVGVNLVMREPVSRHTARVGAAMDHQSGVPSAARSCGFPDRTTWRLRESYNNRA